MLREIVESVVGEAKASPLKKTDLEKIYSYMEGDPYSDVKKKFDGVDYYKLPDRTVDTGTMFYAINKNGKVVSTRAKTSFRAKIFHSDIGNLLITNKLGYPGKKWIQEFMFARL